MLLSTSMLRINAQKSASGAKAYFSVSDYLSDKQEITGNWHGKGATLLGLFGEVDKPHFDQLCDNINPATGEQLTAKTRDGRRVGYDFTWSVPKSVSIVHALTGDDRILQAFRDSISDTMKEMETDMQTRVRRKGDMHDRDTGNITYAEFIHLTSRPVDGVPCPQLHAHCFVFNATYDPVEDQWKAGQFGKIKQDAYFWQQVQQARLANRLQEIGYGVRRTEKDFEIQGVPDSAIKKFSLRKEKIEKRAKEKGITRPETKAKLGATTREAKNDAIPYSRLVEIWQGRLTDQERNALSDLPKLESPPALDNARHARFAVEHSFERASVVDERRLLSLALRHGMGEVTPEGVRNEVNRHGLLKRVEDGKTWVTTRDVLAEESRMIRFAVLGKGTMRPLEKRSRLVGKEDEQSTLSPEVQQEKGLTDVKPFSQKRSLMNDRSSELILHKRLPDSGNERPSDEHLERATLSGEQQAVISHLLTCSDRVMIIRGAAGTGKTTLIKEAVQRMNEAGKHVTMLAPTTAAVGVLGKDGFAANTIAAFENNRDLQASALDGVILVDEAGLVGSKTMGNLFELADRLNARVILMGDKRQLASVERGSPLRVLEDIAKIPVSEVTEIRRQRGEYKEAVKLLSKGNTLEGLDKLDAMGRVKLMPVWDSYKPIARQYVDALEKNETALIVCPTHVEGDKITDEVRKRLKEKGRLGDEEKVFTRLVPVQWTEAERGDVENYQRGAVAQFFRSAGRFKAGQTVRFGLGREESSYSPSDLAACGRYLAVFHEAPISLARGDTIRITAPGKDISGKHKLSNGAQYRVERFDKDNNIILNNGWKLAHDFGHFTHGYVNTAYAAQGRTVDHVLGAISAASYPATNREGFYVMASRGKKSFTLFTDDKYSLRDAIQRSNPRMSATELVKKPKPQFWRRAREAMARVQQNALVAAKRAMYEIQQLTGRQQHALER